MKNLFYILSYAVVLCAMFACENSDPKESDATPQIKYVRPIDVANADILLDKAAMGSTIALIGTGLEGVNEVWFNDQKALLNPVYITSTSIIVDVPGKKPDEITNTITVKTYKGKQCVYDFTVIIPAPIPRSIENEWAHDGMQTVIFGDYFFADENGNLGDVVFPGNLVAEVITFDEQSITVIVPAGSLSGSVTVSSIYGKGRSEFTFRDKEGLFLDVEEPTKVWNTWNRSEFATEGGTSGQYLKLSGNSGNWTWPSDKLQIVYINPAQTPLITPIDDSDMVTNYSLKFEYKSVHWAGTQMYMWFGTNDGGDNIDAANRVQYLWTPFGEDGNDLVTVWKTCTIPLSSFNHCKASAANDVSYGNNFGEIVNFYAFVFGGSNVTTPIEIWMDNFRIVKNK